MFVFTNLNKLTRTARSWFSQMSYDKERINRQMNHSSCRYLAINTSKSDKKFKTWNIQPAF